MIHFARSILFLVIHLSRLTDREGDYAVGEQFRPLARTKGIAIESLRYPGSFACTSDVCCFRSDDFRALPKGGFRVT